MSSFLSDHPSAHPVAAADPPPLPLPLCLTLMACASTALWAALAGAANILLR